MTNLLYTLTDHDHTENELAPWLAECGTGTEAADGLILTALDCAWGHWEYAAGPAVHPYADPEYLKAAEESMWRWDDWIPAGLFDRGFDKDQWHRVIAAMNDLGRFGLSDTSIIRRDLTEPFDESVAALRDDWNEADYCACANGPTRTPRIHSNAWSTTYAYWPRRWTTSHAIRTVWSATARSTRWPDSTI